MQVAAKFHSSFARLPRNLWRLCKLGSSNHRRIDRWPGFWYPPMRRPKEQIPSASRETALLGTVVTSNSEPPDSRMSIIWNQKERMVLSLTMSIYLLEIDVNGRTKKKIEQRWEKKVAKMQRWYFARKTDFARNSRNNRISLRRLLRGRHATGTYGLLLSENVNHASPECLVGRVNFRPLGNALNTTFCMVPFFPCINAITKLMHILSCWKFYNGLNYSFKRSEWKRCFHICAIQLPAIKLKCSCVIENFKQW